MSAHDGRVIVDGERAVLHFERHLPFSVQQVWTAITDPAHRGQWLGRTVIDPRSGGTIETVAAGPPLPPARRRITGRILVWDPPHVFEHEWLQPIVEPGVVRYELVPEGAGTLLRLTHRGLGVPNANTFRTGTRAFLDRLAALLAGEPLPRWAQRVQAISGCAPTGEEFA